MPSYRYYYTYKSSKPTRVEEPLHARPKEDLTKHRRSRHRKSSSNIESTSTSKSSESLRPLYLTVNRIYNWHQEQKDERHSHKREKEHHHRGHEGRRYSRSRSGASNSSNVHEYSSSPPPLLSSSPLPSTQLRPLETNTMPFMYSFGYQHRSACHCLCDNSPSSRMSYPPPPYTSNGFPCGVFGSPVFESPPPYVLTPFGEPEEAGYVVSRPGIVPMVTAQLPALPVTACPCPHVNVLEG